jgi:large subunit ribosomal protein L31
LTRHPETHFVEVVCANCGATFTLQSTASSLSTDICSSCHPAYTGVSRAAIRGDRIERFERRRALAA